MTQRSNRLGLILALGVVVLVGSILYGTRLQNQRVKDIQTNRITSCIATYQAFLDVFQPFFPPVGKRTDSQTANWKKLEAVVDGLTARCVQQTRPG